MKIFLTGGNGFLGSKTLSELVLKGYQVRCLLRRESSTEKIKNLPFESYFGDIRDPESVLQGAKGCDAIIHLAGISSWAQIRAQANQLGPITVDGTRNVFESAKENGNLRTVYVSSCAAINGSKTPIIFNENTEYSLLGTSMKYSIAKHRAEKVAAQYFQKFNSDIVTVNPCEIYGENDVGMVTAGNIIDILKGSTALVCTGGTAVAHVNDISRGIVLALEKGRSGERYILGGENLSILELARIVRRLAGKSDSVMLIPNEVLIPICKGMARLGLNPPVPLDVLEYAVLYWYVDSSKAERELGYTWRSARETFRGLVQWLLDTKRVA